MLMKKLSLETIEADAEITDPTIELGEVLTALMGRLSALNMLDFAMGYDREANKITIYFSPSCKEPDLVKLCDEISAYKGRSGSEMTGTFEKCEKEDIGWALILTLQEKQSVPVAGEIETGDAMNDNFTCTGCGTQAPVESYLVRQGTLLEDAKMICPTCFSEFELKAFMLKKAEQEAPEKKEPRTSEEEKPAPEPKAKEEPSSEADIVSAEKPTGAEGAEGAEGPTKESLLTKVNRVVSDMFGESRKGKHLTEKLQYIGKSTAHMMGPDDQRMELTLYGYSDRSTLVIQFGHSFTIEGELEEIKTWLSTLQAKIEKLAQQKKTESRKLKESQSDMCQDCWTEHGQAGQPCVKGCGCHAEACIDVPNGPYTVTADDVNPPATRNTPEDYEWCPLQCIACGKVATSADVGKTWLGDTCDLDLGSVENGPSPDIGPVLVCDECAKLEDHGYSKMRAMRNENKIVRLKFPKRVTEDVSFDLSPEWKAKIDKLTTEQMADILQEYYGADIEPGDCDWTDRSSLIIDIQGMIAGWLGGKKHPEVEALVNKALGITESGAAEVEVEEEEDELPPEHADHPGEPGPEGPAGEQGKDAGAGEFKTWTGDLAAFQVKIMGACQSLGIDFDKQELLVKKLSEAGIVTLTAEGVVVDLEKMRETILTIISEPTPGPDNVGTTLDRYYS